MGFSQKTLMRGSSVYKGTTGNGSNPAAAFHRYKVIKHKKVTIVDNGAYLIIKSDPSLDSEHYTLVSRTWVPFKFDSYFTWQDWKIKDSTTAYFFEDEDTSKPKPKFWYRDGKVVLQGASIPLKIRSQIAKQELGDSIPSTTETGFNVGFLFGYKFSWNKFRTTTNIFGNQTAKYSLTPGLIFSIGAADLNSASTHPDIPFGRKSPMLTIGGAFVIGFNSFNIGYSMGFDYATGPYSSSWLYQGKMWNGIILSLDLIK
jgi:hypothetical protein